MCNVREASDPLAWVMRGGGRRGRKRPTALTGTERQRGPDYPHVAHVLITRQRVCLYSHRTLEWQQKPIQKNLPEDETGTGVKQINAGAFV